MDPITRKALILTISIIFLGLVWTAIIAILAFPIAGVLVLITKALGLSLASPFVYYVGAFLISFLGVGYHVVVDAQKQLKEQEEK